MVVVLHIFLEEIFLSHRPLRLLPYIMECLRIADPRLLRADMIISREISMRRTYVILKSDGHDHWALDPVCEILDIEIAENLEHLLLRHSRLLCSRLDRITRPSGKNEVIRIIAEERRRRGNSLESSVQ